MTTKLWFRCCAMFVMSAATLATRLPAQSVAPPEEDKAQALRLPDLDRTALTPRQREEGATEVSPAERNPFGLVKPPPVEEVRAEEVETETEEMKIRRILSNTRISGLTGTPGNYTVLMGGLALRAGMKVPRLFNDQAEQLRVTEITEREVRFVFADKDPTRVRTFNVAVDLRPRVRSLLYGELFTNVVKFEAGVPQVPAMPGKAVETLLDGARGGGLESLVERPRAVMGNALAPDESAAPPQPEN